MFTIVNSSLTALFDPELGNLFVFHLFSLTFLLSSPTLSFFVPTKTFGLGEISHQDSNNLAYFAAASVTKTPRANVINSFTGIFCAKAYQEILRLVSNSVLCV